MKKMILSSFLVVSFGLYAFIQKLAQTNAQAPITPNQNDSPKNTSTPIPTNSEVGNNQNPSSPTSIVPKGGLYKDGTYTGDVADAYYGNVQVQVSIQSGKINNVLFLDYPQDRMRSQMINSMAMPYLKQEAIQVQTANVDIVSGATATSQAFQQSLASALAKAK